MSYNVKKHGEVISTDIRTSISTRYKAVTKAINREFWNSQSDKEHSLYVGSYGRGTAIDTSDVDILVELDRDHPIGLLKYAGIICDLEDITGHKIDLVEEGTLKPFAVESVNRDKKLIYERAEKN